MSAAGRLEASEWSPRSVLCFLSVGDQPAPWTSSTPSLPSAKPSLLVGNDSLEAHPPPSYPLPHPQRRGHSAPPVLCPMDVTRNVITYCWLLPSPGGSSHLLDHPAVSNQCQILKVRKKVSRERGSHTLVSTAGRSHASSYEDNLSSALFCSIRWDAKWTFKGFLKVFLLPVSSVRSHCRIVEPRVRHHPFHMWTAVSSSSVNGSGDHSVLTVLSSMTPNCLFVSGGFGAQLWQPAFKNLSS